MIQGFLYKIMIQKVKKLHCLHLFYIFYEPLQYITALSFYPLTYLNGCVQSTISYNLLTFKTDINLQVLYISTVPQYFSQKTSYLYIYLLYVFYTNLDWPFTTYYNLFIVYCYRHMCSPDLNQTWAKVARIVSGFT